jgi:hypothetical protein
VERQRRYRANRRLISLDISRATNAVLQELRSRTTLTTDQVLVRALGLLRADLDRPAQAANHRHARRKEHRDPSVNSQPSDTSGPAPIPPSPENGNQQSGRRTRVQPPPAVTKDSSAPAQFELFLGG